MRQVDLEQPFTDNMRESSVLDNVNLPDGLMIQAPPAFPSCRLPSSRSSFEKSLSVFGIISEIRIWPRMGRMRVLRLRRYSDHVVIDNGSSAGRWIASRLVIFKGRGQPALRGHFAPAQIPCKQAYPAQTHLRRAAVPARPAASPRTGLA